MQSFKTTQSFHWKTVTSNLVYLGPGAVSNYFLTSLQVFEINPLFSINSSKDDGPGYFNRTMDLKEVNPNLKILLGVGGTKENAYLFESCKYSPFTKILN
jgi:hypothetical protein